MAFCVICGNQFHSDRQHAQTCSSKCRSKLSRERKKKGEQVKRNQLNLFEHSKLAQLENAVPSAALLVRQIHLMYGKEPAMWALEAIALTCDYVERVSDGVEG